MSIINNRKDHKHSPTHLSLGYNCYNSGCSPLPEVEREGLGWDLPIQNIDTQILVVTSHLGRGPTQGTI